MSDAPVNRKGLPEAQAAQRFLADAADKVILYPGVLPTGRDDGWKKRPNFTASHKLVLDLRNETARPVRRGAPHRGPAAHAAVTAGVYFRRKTVKTPQWSETHIPSAPKTTSLL